LHRFVYRYHKHILVFSLVITALSVLLSARLKLDFDLLSLLPEGNATIHKFLDITEKFGNQSLLIIMIEPSPDVEAGKTENFIDRFSSKLNDSDLIKQVAYKREKIQFETLIPLLKYLPLLLRSEDIEKLCIKLSDAGINQQIQENKKLLMTPFSLGMKDIINHDPLAFRELLESRTNVSSGSPFVMRSGDYFRTRELIVLKLPEGEKLGIYKLCILFFTELLFRLRLAL